MLFEEIVVFLVCIVPRVLATSCMSKRCGGPSDWLPIAKNICYGTKNRAFGKFAMNMDCNLFKIRLVHVSGFQSTANNNEINRSRWGCTRYSPNSLCTLLLKQNQLWTPMINDTQYGSYFLDGYSIDDDVIVFKVNETLALGSEIQIAFGADFGSAPDSSNEGTHCVDVEMSCFQ